jgi:hypothetical protein
MRRLAEFFFWRLKTPLIESDAKFFPAEKAKIA